MHLFDQRILGIAILILLGMLVSIKQAATGSILDKPKGNLLVQAVNIFNLFFLLIVNPLAAILLIARRLVDIDLSHIAVENSSGLTAVEIIGLFLYVAGFALMAWALITLRRNYQLGGTAPRAEDELVSDGPYRFIRHPMYASALAIALGLFFLAQSIACLIVFTIYLLLIIPLIGLEENGLEKAYGEKYGDYRRKTRRLVPFIY